MNNILSLLAMAGTTIVGFFTIGGFFAELEWRLAWFSNPRGHFLAALIVATMWFVITGRGRWAAVAAVIAVINLATIFPLFITPNAAGAPDSMAQTLSIAHLNTNKGEADLTLIQELDADLIFLQEVTPALNLTLAERLPLYSILHSHPLSNTHGSAILIRQGSVVKPIKSEIINLPKHSSRPLMAAVIQVNDREVALLNLHTTRAQNRNTDAGQQYELSGVAVWSSNVQKDADTEVIIMGDFNLTPWSTRFWRLLRTGHLKNSQRGFGIQQTWPSTVPLFLGIPIDHAVHSDGIRTVDRQVIRTTGTDHAILYGSFAF